MRCRTTFTLALLVSAAACSRDEKPPAPAQAPDAGEGRAASNATAAASSATPPAASAAAPSAGASGTYAGKYTSHSAQVYVPADKDWAGVKWRGDDGGIGTGEGSLTMKVDPSGRLIGSVDGPLGPGKLSGFFDGKQLTATVSRNEASDLGFTGTVIAHVESARVEGVMHLSSANAGALREAPFTLSKQP